MSTVENLEIGITLLQDSIESSKQSIDFYKKHILNDLQSPNFDDSTIDVIESRLKRIQKLFQSIEKNESKIRLIKQIINDK